MDGVMSLARAFRILADCQDFNAHLVPTFEPFCEPFGGPLSEAEILRQRLLRYEFTPDTTTTDENCLRSCVFKAVAHQVSGDREEYFYLYQRVVAWLYRYRVFYEPYLPEGINFEQYANSLTGEVDELLKHILSDMLNLRIVELVASQNYCISEYVPSIPPNNTGINQTIYFATSARHTDPIRRVEDHVIDEPTFEPTNEERILQQRMVRYRKTRRRVEGDGNCVVRSIADQLTGNEELHDAVRKIGVAQLIVFRHLYEDYVNYRLGMNYDEYVRHISCMYQDVDPLLTHAISDALGLRIIELVSNYDYSVAEYIPRNRLVYRTIQLVSSARHTDSMYSL